MFVVKAIDDRTKSTVFLYEKQYNFSWDYEKASIFYDKKIAVSIARRERPEYIIKIKLVRV